MSRVISSIRTYYYPSPEAPERPVGPPDLESFYDRQGRVILRRDREGEERLHYDDRGNISSIVRDPYEGEREVKNYYYTEEGLLRFVHLNRQVKGNRLVEVDRQTVVWSEDGLTREWYSFVRGGQTDKLFMFMREFLNLDGTVSMQYHYDENEVLLRNDSWRYDPTGHMWLHVWKVRGDRGTSIHWCEYDEYDRPQDISYGDHWHSFFYKDDEEGNWIFQEEYLGDVTYRTVLREIEYVSL